MQYTIVYSDHHSHLHYEQIFAENDEEAKKKADKFVYEDLCGGFGDEELYQVNKNGNSIKVDW